MIFEFSIVDSLFLLLLLLIPLKPIYSKLSYYINIKLLNSISIFLLIYIELFMSSEHEFINSSKTTTVSTIKKIRKTVKTACSKFPNCFYTHISTLTPTPNE